MAYFAQPRIARDQRILIPDTLDDLIPDDHPARVLDEILRQMDWAPWEARYHGRRGKPPIHPMIMAAVILYGLMRRVQSSRVLEYLISSAIDFMWLAEGRSIDHSTICLFRKEFDKELRSLFRQTARIALTIGWLRLEEVAIDGTRTQANNARNRTWTAADLEKAIEALATQWGNQLSDTEQADALQAPIPAVPPELADARDRHEQLLALLAQLKDAEEARRKEGIDPARNPAQRPSTDPDSKVMPNKEGGYAPNYTPLVATDTHGGFIVAAAVIGEVTESTQTVAMVNQIVENFGQQPDFVLADGHHGTGQNIEAFEARGIELLSPVPSQEPQPGNPAFRSDPTQPVPVDQRAQLPINPQTKKLDKSCFTYDAEQDCYFCPEGKRMEFEKSKPDVRQGQRIERNVYRCGECVGCPLAGQCISAKSQGGRTVTRDEHAEARERQAAKMKEPENQERYKRRLHAAETPFGWIKEVLGLRQFLLRGEENVDTEWLWACIAYNVRKLILRVTKTRADLEKMMLETAS